MVPLVVMTMGPAFSRGLVLWRLVVDLVLGPM